MYSYPVGQQVVEGPGYIEQIRTHFQNMTQTQKRICGMKIFSILCVIMIWCSFYKFRRIGSAAVVPMVFGIFSLICSGIIGCALKRKNIAKLEKGIKVMRVVSVLSIYNLFLFIFLGGFAFLGVKWFIFLAVFAALAKKNKCNLEKFRNEYAPTEWADQ